MRVARGIARRFLLSHDFSRGTLIKIAGYTACPLSTVYDYCKEHNGIIRVYDDSLEYPARSLCKNREEFERNIFAEPVMRPSYYIYASRMRDAIIFGNEDIILAGGQCLSDRKNQIQGNEFYISPNIRHIMPYEAVVRMPKSPEVIERGIDLVKMWSLNYYHFSLEALARLQLVDAIEEYRSWPLIIDEGALRNVWNMQLLEMVNEYGHPVITVKPGKAYLVREMVYPSFLNWGEGGKSGYVPSVRTMAAKYGMIYPSFLNWSKGEKCGYAPRMSTRATEYIRKKIMDHHKPSRIYRNVYMARGNNRRILNENEVANCLERYGFEIIYPRIDNYTQILDAFMTADNIIGATGTNVVSQILSKPHTNVYIISPFEYQHEPQGFSVTDASNCILHFIPADVRHLGPILDQTTFTANIATIEAIAKKLSQ